MNEEQPYKFEVTTNDWTIYFKMKKLLEDMDVYLNTNKYTNIANGSNFHLQMKMLLNDFYDIRGMKIPQEEKE
jgi:hypothetical protein